MVFFSVFCLFSRFSILIAYLLYIYVSCKIAIKKRERTKIHENPQCKLFALLKGIRAGSLLNLHRIQFVWLTQHEKYYIFSFLSHYSGIFYISFRLHVFHVYIPCMYWNIRGLVNVYEHVINIVMEWKATRIGMCVSKK